jgi:Bacterial Ig-like domain (group 1)
VPKRNTLQPLHQTRRWISGGIGLGAALATILASAHSCGLIGDEGTRYSVANLAVSWIGLTPLSDTARSLGDTLRYVATVTDRRGTALVGAAIEWKTDDAAIATVDSAGFVVARAPGATSLMATVAGKVARARIVVRPRAARFEFGSDSVLRVPEGGHASITVKPQDARGHPILRSAASLHTGDSALARVEGSDVIGRTAGRTALIAELDGARDSIVLDIVPVPGRVTLVKGADQHAGPESRLGEPIGVRVDSRVGRPMAGIVVRFAPEEGAGTVRPDTAVTNVDGLASTTWRTGDRPGLERLHATVAGVDSGAVAVAEVEPSRANTRVAQVEDAPSGLAAGADPVVVGIQVTDSSGRALPGVPVVWKPLDGGRIVGRAARTDSAGEVHAEWWLGPRAGVQRAKVQLGSGRSLPPATVLAASFPGAPAKLTGLTSLSVRGVAGTDLSRPVSVRVTDATGNGVPGVAVSVSGGGPTSDSLVVSDSTGRADIHWRLGEKVGPQALTVSIDNVAPLRFTAAVTPGAAANLALLDPAGAPPLRGGAPVQARVTDVYGNPVPDALVVFSVSDGSVKPARVMSGKDGVAATTWKLGRRSGSQSLTALLQKSGAKDVMEMTAPSASAAPTAHSAPRKTASAGPAKTSPLTGKALN